MGINIGDAVPKGVYVGDTKVSAVYVGDSKIRPISIGAPTGITATAGAEKVTIKWTDPADQTYVNWASSTLVRSTAHIPTTINDGTPVLTETTRNQYSSTGYDNTGLTAGTTYYYNVFATGDNGTVTGGTGASATPTSSGWQPGANTLLYLPLKTNILDYSGNNVQVTTDNLSSYRTFDSYSAKYTIPGTVNGAKTQYGTDTGGYSSFTICCWMNMSEYHSNSHFIEVAGGNLIYIPDQNKFRFECFGGSTRTVFSTGSANLNTWYWVLGIRAGSTISLYINNVLQGTNTISGTKSNQPITIPGHQNSSVDRCIRGHLSEVIYENKAWTTQERTNYYNQTKSNYGIS